MQGAEDEVAKTPILDLRPSDIRDGIEHRLFDPGCGQDRVQPHEQGVGRRAHQVLDGDFLGCGQAHAVAFSEAGSNRAPLLLILGQQS